MIRANKSSKQLTGLFCLPTSSKYHCQERERSGAFAAGMTVFILTATRSIEDGGYPPAVVLTCEEGELPDLELGSEPETQHAEVRKNLPPRKVTGVVMADGSTFGEIPPKGVSLPHWEYIKPNADGSASTLAIQATKDRIEKNRKDREEQKQATRDAKKAPKAA